MLFNILLERDISGIQKLLFILISLFCVLLSLSIHEMCHGLAAYWMGDDTAKYQGRLSVNPLRHLDPIGALWLFLFGFGWAKPVMVNSQRFKHRKAGMVVTALAGPVSNFILAFVAEIGVVALGSISFESTASLVYKLASLSYIMCFYLAMLNIGLGVFNLIPIPPLDGSKVLNAVLPARLYFKIMQYERYGFILVILLINLPVFNNVLSICRNAILGFYDMIIGTFI